MRLSLPVVDHALIRTRALALGVVTDVFDHRLLDRGGVQLVEEGLLLAGQGLFELHLLVELLLLIGKNRVLACS